MLVGIRWFVLNSLQSVFFLRWWIYGKEEEEQ